MMALSMLFQQSIQLPGEEPSFPIDHTDMNIYEVIFWSSRGERNSEDTIYLVRAPNFRAAVEDVQRNGSPVAHGTRLSLADVVYEIGVDVSPYASGRPCILRGPYFAFAVNHGWKEWHRKLEGVNETNDWEQRKLEDPDGTDGTVQHG